MRGPAGPRLAIMAKTRSTRTTTQTSQEQTMADEKKTQEQLDAEAAAAKEAAEKEAAEKLAAEQAAAAAAAAEAEKKSAELVKVAARGNDYYNPYSRQRFRENEEVEAVLDSWLQCQLDAGYIARV